MKFGVRAHDFGKSTPEELAGRISKTGASFIQLALSKALKEFESLPRQIPETKAEEITSVFKNRGIRISVLGCYFNPGHPDPIIRTEGIQAFQEHLRLAKIFGTSIVATETGSVREDSSPDSANKGDEAYRMFLSTLEPLVVVAEETGSLVCIEPAAHHIICTPARVKQVLEDISSRSLGILLDPVNFLTPGTVGDQEKIMDDCFHLWPDRIKGIHAKDFVVENHELRIVPPGTGGMNYPYLLTLLKQNKVRVDIILENCSPHAVPSSVAYLNDLGF